MMGKSDNEDKRDLFRSLLRDFIDLNHKLILFSNKIDWSYFEDAFASRYSHKGQR